MTDVTKRNRSNKRKGAHFEVALTNYFITQKLDAERVARRGKRDIGDVIVRVAEKEILLVEAKNAARLSLPAWLDQARVEAENYRFRNPGALVQPIVVVKRRGQGVGRSYVVQELDTFLDWL